MYCTHFLTRKIRTLIRVLLLLLVLVVRVRWEGLVLVTVKYDASGAGGAGGAGSAGSAGDGNADGGDVGIAWPGLLADILKDIPKCFLLMSSLISCRSGR